MAFKGQQGRDCSLPVRVIWLPVPCPHRSIKIFQNVKFFSCEVATARPFFRSSLPKLTYLSSQSCYAISFWEVSKSKVINGAVFKHSKYQMYQQKRVLFFSKTETKNNSKSIRKDFFFFFFLFASVPRVNAEGKIWSRQTNPSSQWQQEYLCLLDI